MESKPTYNRFCMNQFRPKDCESVMCAAHFFEDRVLYCPYKNAKDREKRKQKCEGFEAARIIKEKKERLKYGERR